MVVGQHSVGSAYTHQHGWGFADHDVLAGGCFSEQRLLRRVGHDEEFPTLSVACGRRQPKGFGYFRQFFGFDWVGAVLTDACPCFNGFHNFHVIGSLHLYILFALPVSFHWQVTCVIGNDSV
jgi:hypothetical protein